MMRFDDALRGWGYEPLYEPRAHGLFHEARMRNDASYRGVPVRDHACIYTRLVGFAVHELIHAAVGEPGEANYGVPWGLPYGVPEDLPAGEEEGHLLPFNLAEACAFVGVGAYARALFGIEWPLATARDVGTYGFFGGNALVEVPPGFRPIPHVDRQIAPTVYYPLARDLEARARAFIDASTLADWCEAFRAAEEVGRARRPKPFPEPAALAAIEPVAVGRNDLCVCGSGKKFKRCCGA